MKLSELKTEIQKYQHFEDTSIIDVSIASIVANSLQLGDPVWLLIIGASSGGKSQILRPLAQSNPKFIHRIDDLTENTLLSGVKAAQGEQVSLLLRIGPTGIIVVSDFTVIMSKPSETQAAILSQLRMLYDGEMTKFSGNSSKPIRWPETGKGYLGFLAGSTPSIYSKFEEYADMGERFIYYRMKDIDAKVATRLALSRKKTGHNLDEVLAGLYGEYIAELIQSVKKEEIVLSQKVEERIIEVASFAERVRTPAQMDWKGESIKRIPVSALPMRVALQLKSIALGISAIKKHETGTTEFEENELSMIDWICYSLANEEKRACLKILASNEFEIPTTSLFISDKIGLSTQSTNIILQNLAAIKILIREGDSEGLTWRFADKQDYSIVQRIEGIKETKMEWDRGNSFKAGNF